MNLWRIATRSLRYYWSTNLAIALGVAAATAVLSGALIVGESMRQSLRELTLDRLGMIDELLVSDGFFREQLADEIAQSAVYQTHYDQIAPAIMFPGGTVATEPASSLASDVPRPAQFAGQVTVLGITNRFWQFDQALPAALREQLSQKLSDETAAINQALADDLGITNGEVQAGSATITVRIPKQTRLPADSALGRKTDLIESLVNLQVVAIVPNQGLGRFGMFPTQADPLNVYLPIDLLQNSLARSVLQHKADPRQANMLLLSGRGSLPPQAKTTMQLRDAIRPSLSDLGFQLQSVQQTYRPSGHAAVTVFEYVSLSSDKLVLSDQAVRSVATAFPDAKPVFTYLANDIRRIDQESGIPFSMLAGIDFDTAAASTLAHQFRPLSAVTGQSITSPGDGEIVLNTWAADDLEVGRGDKVVVTYFEPETTHGSQVSRTAEFTVTDIAKLTTPAAPFGYRRRRGITPPVFDAAPAIANDPDLTPIVPGVTDAQSIEAWDLPFSTADRIRPQDDDYWENFRTTPKAFVNLETAQTLFTSRFGETTSFRIPKSAGSVPQIKSQLLQRFADDGAELGLHLLPIKRRGLAASSGATPFDVLFLALSMFVIGSALILVSLLFRLSLQQRASEVGLLRATGFPESRLKRTWLIEMILVGLVGAALGIGLGIGYAALMIHGLTTWWVGAIAKPFLTMHLSWVSLSVGFASGLLAGIATLAISLRKSRQQPVIGLLRGEIESSSLRAAGKPAGKVARYLPWIVVASAIGLALVALGLAGEPQAGAFLGAGCLMLVAGLVFVYRWLRGMAAGAPSQTTAGAARQALSLGLLARLSMSRNPLRSTLTIGLVAVASFLIVSVNAFRLSPTERGTAGFDWIATSSQPVFDDLRTAAGQTAALGAGYRLPESTSVFSLRYQAGEDASCNNLYQSTQPRVLGVPEAFVAAAPRFGWASSLVGQDNPWELLRTSGLGHTGSAEDPIPVVLDKNTANYSLKIFALGTVREVEYDSGPSFHFVVVGLLENTVLQGSLLMAEADFIATFPRVAGYQYFLIDDGTTELEAGATASSSPSVQILEDRLSDLGFDARSAPRLLANFMSVQNTYLSTFQMLGALGLLLGTIGLAAVQVRSVLERKNELGLMRAVGYQLQQLSRLVMLENAWLLLMGLLVGIGSALLTTLPHWWVGAASVPWSALLIIFGVILAVGLLAAWLASQNLGRMRLLDSLQD